MGWVIGGVIFCLLVIAWFVWEFFTAEQEECHENDDDMDQGAALGMGGAA